MLTETGILNYAKALLLAGDMESALSAASSVTGIEASYIEMLAAAGTGDWNRVEKLAENCLGQKDFAFLPYVRYYSGIARYRLENYAGAYALLHECILCASVVPAATGIRNRMVGQCSADCRYFGQDCAEFP